MKTKLLLICAALNICLVGCARFGTVQTDTSYDNGQITRKITTKASASTVIESKSALANWKASQTDKTQGASVGSLNQEANTTNAATTLKELRLLLELLNQ